MGFFDVLTDILNPVSTVSNIVGGFLGLNNQKETNEANIAMQRETNAQNYKMFHEQQDFMENMWNKANAYNTPVETAKRLREAGINPYAMLGSNGQGSMSSAGLVSSPSATPMVAPRATPLDYSPVTEGINRSVSTLLDNEGKGIENKMRAIELMFKTDEKLVNLAERRSEIVLKLNNAKLADAERKKLESEKTNIDNQIELYNRTKDSLVRQTDATARLQEESANRAAEDALSAKLQREYQEQVNKFLPQLQGAQLAQLQAVTAESYSQANLNKQMSKESKARTATEITRNQIEVLRRNHVKISQKLEDALLKANRRQIDAITAKTRASNNFVQNYSPLAGYAAGAASIIKLAK